MAAVAAAAAAATATVPAALPAARPPPPDMDVDLDLEDENSQELERAISAIDERQIDARDSSDPMSMRLFYRRLLPWKQLFTWLNQDLPHLPGRNWTHREFAFTLQNDAYLRYNSFANADELKNQVCRLNPSRFEIGPVYSAKPKDRKTVQKASFRPVYRELVLDIDMTDYDEVRTCCSGKGICRRCWAFIAVAVDVLDEALRTDFGFRHLLWVYSGRRGIHCWVSDKAACELGDDARKAIVGWLEVVKGSANQVKKVDAGFTPGSATRSLHPSLRRAIGGEGPASGPLKLAFVDTVLKDQDCFRRREHWEVLLQLLPSGESEAVERLRAKWERSPNRSSLDKWGDVMEAAHKSGEVRSAKVWKPCLEDVILQYTYPRIDAEVSKHLNHLLKSPFVVHPATGKVCVPIDPRKVHEFDPETSCPTVAQLLRELNSWEAKHGGGDSKASPPPPQSNMSSRYATKASPSAGGEEAPAASSSTTAAARADWEKTSLRPFVELFERHCNAIAKESRQARQQRFSTDF
ncbi:related to DNA primase 48K protein PRI1 [Pseudozyma flocculosa]|uniref:DNA primase n=1 Tax=Pseudozyma flocculosa TaxID=84751 RepID=A0A5C3F883_9BASI|nr:related to DNA primase 48K protein PRI1 [Pseudozyma flocculosa]